MKLIIILLLVVSCSSTSSKKEAHSHQNDGHKKHHKSMNDKFMKDDLNVKLWQERFENRDRDVYKNQTQIVEALNLRKNMSVVDVGSGTGFFLRHLHKEISPKGQLYAVELAPNFVEFIKGRAKIEKLDRLKVIKGGLDKTNMPLESVDLVFVCDTFHHFDRPDNMLRDFFNILKPGGTLVIVDFDLRGKETKEWVKKHVTRKKDDYINEVEGSGYFKFLKESKPGLKENVMLHFKRN